jgi:putative phosphonate metabolism protein
MRHAIYFCPNPASELHRLGSTWLGRDAFSCDSLRQPDVRLHEITSHPRRYGLHGTLKPPFRLKQNASSAAFDAAVRALSSQHESFQAPALMLAEIDGFLALLPDKHCTPLDELAADCVQQIDDFRTPPGEAELRRRRAAGLTETQEQLLQQWGYPYVLEEFQFHITLTDRLDAEKREWALPLAEQHFAPVLGKPLSFDAITVMIEPDEGDDFRVLERFPLVYNALKAA